MRNVQVIEEHTMVNLVKSNSEILSDFVNNLKSACLSGTTIQQYSKFLNHILLGTSKHICDLTKEDIFEWLANYQIGKPPRTLCHRVSILISFFKYCVDVDIIDEIPISRRMKPLKTPRGEIQILASDEKAILDKKSEFFKVLRDRIMYDFTFETGLRRSELVGLNKSDINLHKRIATISGKGNYHRVVHFSTKMALELENYIPTVNGPALFVNRYGNRISSKHFWRVCKFLLKEGNLDKNFYPHLIRHMRITELVKESDSILDAQKEAGHHNLTSTLWYNHLTIEDLRPFYDRGSPK